MIIVNGYAVTKKTASLTDVEEILRDIQNAVTEKAKREYHKLLSREIEDLVDDIALNVVPRPDVPILEAAIGILNEKIAYACATGNCTPYDLRITVHVLTDSKTTYLKINSGNMMYDKAIRKVNGIMSFNLETGGPDNTADPEREKIWEKLMGTYADTDPLGTQLFPHGDIPIDEKKLKFTSVSGRASRRAMHNLLNRYTSMLSMERQMPPHKIMPIITDAMEMYANDSVSKDERLRMEGELKNILPVIDLELIKRSPNASIEETEAGTDDTEEEEPVTEIEDLEETTDAE